jgi:hypothetical protein
MGNGLSVDLECDPLGPSVLQLKGTLIVTNNGKKDKKLIRPPLPRVTLQYRARCVYVEKGVPDKNRELGNEILWNIGGYVADESDHPIVLKPGKNYFPFCYDIPESPVLPPKVFYERTKCQCTYYEYHHILRAGCPPLTKDIQSFPRLLANESDYQRWYTGRTGIDVMGMTDIGMNAVGGFLSTNH